MSSLASASARTQPTTSDSRCASSTLSSSAEGTTCVSPGRESGELIDRDTRVPKGRQAFSNRRRGQICNLHCLICNLQSELMSNSRKDAIRPKQPLVSSFRQPRRTHRSPTCAPLSNCHPATKSPPAALLCGLGVKHDQLVTWLPRSPAPTLAARSAATVAKR